MTGALRHTARVDAAWDAAAGVWHTTWSQPKGVHSSGATLEELHARLVAVLPDLFGLPQRFELVLCVSSDEPRARPA